MSWDYLRLGGNVIVLVLICKQRLKS